MSEKPDKESKTEEATEKKVRDAVEKGNLPFAKEMPVFASFLAILVFAIFFAKEDAIRLGQFLAIFVERPEAWVLETQHDAIALYRIVFIEIAKMLATVMALLVMAGIGASILQNAPRFVVDRVQPKLSRISLKEGWQRIFGQKGLVEFAKAVGKLVVAGGFLVLVLSEAQNRIVAGMITSPAEFGSVIRDIAVQILVTVTLVMAVIALGDLLWSRHHWRQELRMTRQEVKDEVKQTDGDPLMKARMRSLQRDRARQRMMASVPQATLVIANPTHFAIALRYRRDQDEAPVVVAKGQDLIALRIREIATMHDIPIFEEPVLARSMYKQVSVDSLIPPQFYRAVAELVRVVYGAGENSQRKANA